MKKRNVDLEENIKNQKEKKGDGVEKLTLKKGDGVNFSHS